MLALKTSFLLLSSPLGSLLGWAAFLAVFAFVLYIYFGVTLMVIARKTATPSSGLAWVPFLNLYLMCKVGRRPGWWFILLLIPVIGIFFAALVWMSIADARNRPAWIGGLAVVPLLGLAVPLYLAVGRGSGAGLTMASRACPRCGSPIVGAEAYCRNCGQPAQSAAPAFRTSTPKMATMSAAWTLVSLLVVGGLGWFVVFRGLSYNPPNRAQPEIPPRVAGTMTEFPVDSKSDKQLQPEDVIAQSGDVGGGASRTSEPLPKERLPPGVDGSNLQKRSSGLTSAVYRKRKAEGTSSTPQSEINSVYVSVLKELPTWRNAGQEVATSVASATGGTKTNVRVQSPGGAVYNGTKIRSNQNSVYVLEKQGSDILIIVYAASSEAEEDAARLATDVGNGQGLNDYPETKETLWALPQKVPNGFVLQEMRSQSRASLGLSDANLSTAQTKDADTARWIEQIKQLIPERMITAKYSDGSGRPWQVLVYDYESSYKARNNWFLLKWTLGFRAQGSVTVNDENGLYFDSADSRLLFFQKGPYLIGIRAPASSTTDQLAAFGDGVQV
jgi:hypothetical protein